MKKNIIIIILIALLIAVLFAAFVTVRLQDLKINKLNQSILNKERAYEITLTEFIVNYDSLYKSYQKFLGDYRQLLTEQEVQNARLEEKSIYGVDWTEFEVTAYTSQECGTITSIGIDLKANYAKYLNIAAVDPEVVPYGSTLLIKFSDGLVKAYITADCGSAIKGKKIDLYFTDVEEAKEFGRQILQVEVIK